MQAFVTVQPSDLKKKYLYASLLKKIDLDGRNVRVFEADTDIILFIKKI